MAGILLRTVYTVMECVTWGAVYSRLKDDHGAVDEDGHLLVTLPLHELAALVGMLEVHVDQHVLNVVLQAQHHANYCTKKKTGYI